MYQHVMPLGSGKTPQFFRCFSGAKPKMLHQASLFILSECSSPERSRRAWWQRKWMQVSWSASMRFGWSVCWLHWGPLVCAPLFRAFRTFDLDKDGSLSREELVRALAWSRFSDGCVSRGKMTFTKFGWGLTTLGASPEEAQKVHQEDVTHCHGRVFFVAKPLFAGHGGVRCEPNWTHQLYRVLAGVRGTRMGNKNHLGPESCLDHLRLRSRICDKEVLKRETGSWNCVATAGDPNQPKDLLVEAVEGQS